MKRAIHKGWEVGNSRTFPLIPKWLCNLLWGLLQAYRKRVTSKEDLRLADFF